MQLTVPIDQGCAMRWKLSLAQSLVFSFVYSLPSWATSKTVDGQVFYYITKGKIIEELPLLTDKRDTAYRHLKSLEDAGLIEIKRFDGSMFIRLTDKAKEWNRKSSESTPRKNIRHSEKNPSTGKKSDPRKKIRDTSENFPSDLGNISDVSVYQDHYTKDQVNPIGSSADADKPARKKSPDYSPDFLEAWSQYPKRAGSNPKREANRHWLARIRDGTSPDSMLAGVMRYAEFCRLTGKTSTEYVMQAKRFFGPDEHFTNDWSVPNASNQAHGNGRTLSAAERVSIACGYNPDGSARDCDESVVATYD